MKLQILGAIMLMVLAQTSHAEVVGGLGGKDDFHPSMVGAGYVTDGNSYANAHIFIGGDDHTWFASQGSLSNPTAVGLGEIGSGDPLAYTITNTLSGSGASAGWTFFRPNERLPSNGWVLNTLQDSEIRDSDILTIGGYDSNGDFAAGRVDGFNNNPFSFGSTVSVARDGETFFAGTTNGDTFTPWGGDLQWSAIHTTAVPEPSSVIALGVIGTAIAVRRGRRRNRTKRQRRKSKFASDA